MITFFLEFYQKCLPCYVEEVSQQIDTFNFITEKIETEEDIKQLKSLRYKKYQSLLEKLNKVTLSKPI